MDEAFNELRHSNSLFTGRAKGNIQVFQSIQMWKLWAPFSETSAADSKFVL